MPGNHRSRSTEFVKSLRELSDAELELHNCRVAVGAALRDERERKGLTQLQFAKSLGIHQPLLSRMERAEPAVSFDMMLEAFFALGKSTQQLAMVLTAKPKDDKPKTALIKVRLSRQTLQKRARRNAPQKIS